MAGYGAVWKARLEMMRPGNAAMAAVGVVIGGVLVAGVPHPAAWVAAFLVTAYGNVLNDITDRRIDAAAHRDRPLPSGRLGVQEAKAFMVLLLGLGLLEAWVAGGVALLAFAAINALLLAAYDLRLKRWPLVGNLAVAALVASTFLFGATAVVGWDAAIGHMPLRWVLAMVFLTNLAREVLKDIEDADGDEGRCTLPQVIGPAAAGWVASVAVGIAIGIDAALVWAMDWTLIGRTVLAGAGGAFFVASGLGCAQAGLGQRALKWAMLVALLGLLLAPLDGVFTT